MEISDLLITTAQSDQQFSACLWDYNTLNVRKHYKNGGSVAPKCFELVGRDYFLASQLGKPLLHSWLLNNQDIVKNVRLILPEPANCLAVCPEKTYLAVGINCKVYIWHLPSGKLLSVQEKNFQPITCIKFSNDGNFLLIGGQDGLLINYCLNDLVTLSSNFSTQSEMGKVEPLYIKKDHSMAIKDLHVGIFGTKSRFSTVSVDKTCRIYNLLDGEILRNIVFEDCLTSVIFDSWFGALYVGTESGNIMECCLKEVSKTLTHHINEKSSITLSGHTSRIVCLALNTSETILASGSLDCFVYTWDVKLRQVLKLIKHNSPITNARFVISYENFFAETFKPEVIIQSLERTIDTSKELVVAKMQDEDIEDDEDDFKLSHAQNKKELIDENMKLRGVNKQLYEAAVLFAKKNFAVKDSKENEV